MKQTFAYIALAALLLLNGCEPKKPDPPRVTPPKEKTDPELTLSGVPASLASGESFSLTVSSKSEGKITVTLDNPAVASISSDGSNKYTVSAVSVQDSRVTISASQEENGDYAAASKSASFNVTGSGQEGIPGPDDAIDGTAVSYEEIEGDIVNPERGLYTAYELHGSSQTISGSDVRAKRLTGHSLWLLEFYLTDFMSGNISTSYLKKIENCLDAIRDGGAKAIVRFAYRDNNNNLDQDQEPEVSVVLKHVEQLKPILIKSEDILFVLQAGFIGSWGEWYYTTHFTNMSSRKQLADALLDAVPASRQIQLRTPAFKMKMYGLSVKDTLTAATAHDGSIASRLAGHNDCFGADASDQGTFEGDDTRAFWKADTRYTIMGGETCAVSDFCLCPNTLKDLEDYHWTYLHDGYNRDVLSRWQKDGCFDEIQSRLGYRLVLKDIHYGAIEAGKSCKITIRMFNKGFAAPMNPREAWLIWVGSDGKVQKSVLGVDPRTWHPGYNGIVTSFTPTSAKGALYLELSDPLLPDNPSYSIALANKDVFDSNSGSNKLFEIK